MMGSRIPNSNCRSDKEIPDRNATISQSSFINTVNGFSRFEDNSTRNLCSVLVPRCSFLCRYHMLLLHLENTVLEIRNFISVSWLSRYHTFRTLNGTQINHNFLSEILTTDTSHSPSTAGGTRKVGENSGRSSSLQLAGAARWCKAPSENNITPLLDRIACAWSTITVCKIKTAINNCTLLPRCSSHCQNQPHCNRHYCIFFKLLLNYLYIMFLAKRKKKKKVFPTG